MNERTGSTQGVLESLSAAVGRLRRNPVILLGALAVTLLSSVFVIPSFVDPLLANLSSIVWLAVWPFLIAGLLGMVVEANTGEARFSTLLSDGKANYASMLGATLLFTAGIFAVLFATAILVLVVAIAALAGEASGVADGDISLLLVGLALVFLIPYFFVYLFLQFYDIGIVAGGETAVSSLGHSIGLVRRNFPGVVGYTLVFYLIQSIGYGPGYAVLFLGGMEVTDTGQWVIVSESLVVGGGLLVLTLGTLAMALAFTYHVTFYESITPDADDQSPSNSGEMVA